MTAADESSLACPHCGGPLDVLGSGDAACERRHTFTVGEVMLEQARTSARATWQAVQALRERARTARWAATDPDLYGFGTPESLERAAAQDDEMAAVLCQQAEALDATISRLVDGVEPRGD